MPVNTLALRTAAWYGDEPLTLAVPESWDVRIFAPRAAPPLTEPDIIARCRSSSEQPAIAELARGKRRPVIIVDDLNRPTPASAVIPVLLEQLKQAGIAAHDVSIVMAPGTHGAPRPDALIKKVGPDAAATCRLLVHDCYRDLVRMGRTSFGTPVLVNRQVAESDYLIGVGGVYPNWTAGFGGGSKLILGILGFDSIAALHLGHQSMGWGTPNERSDFRRDLDEIARLVGLRTTVSLLLDGARQVTEIFCGDPWTSYASAVELARERFRAPLPDGADVVISNAYPNDLSLTFTRMKGMRPITAASPLASRIVVAACSEGVGFHGLFPLMGASPGHRRRLRMTKARVLLRKPRRLLPRVGRRVARGLKRPAPTKTMPTWLFRPEVAAGDSLPAEVAGITVMSSWDEVVDRVQHEQGGRGALRVAFYSCAALQWLG